MSTAPAPHPEELALRQTFARLWDVRGLVGQRWNGENETWRVGEHVVRRYRLGRRSRVEIEAEWAWADALAGVGICVPRVLPGRDGAVVQDLDGAHAVAMTWHEGRPLDWADAEDVRLLGHVTRAVMDAARQVRPPVGWVGWSRPALDPARILARVRRVIPCAISVTSAQRVQLLALADRIDGLSLTGPPGFLHADLHGYNVLRGPRGPVVIDLDDCAIGPAYLELATPRIHLRARTELERTWPCFCEGLGFTPDPRELALATVLFALDTVCAFDGHLDLPELSDPHAVVGRYLAYAEAELPALGPSA